MLEKIYCKLFVFYLRICHVKIEGRLGLRFGVDIPRLKRKLVFGDFVNLDRNVSLVLTATDHNQDLHYLLKIGSGVYINRNTSIDATVGIEIGNDTMIGPNCYITDHDHSFIGLPPSTPIGELPLDGKKTIIGKNVWLGANVIVLKGVTIGDNAIIGAGSIVTKSIPNNTIAVGSPCKVIKLRE
jgi:acetyltransferase-like isoleucine patch superfamily enzyme